MNAILKSVGALRSGGTVSVPKPANVHIKPAPLNMARPEGLPRYWYADDPFLTAFWTAFAGQFPRGERFMIKAVRLFRDQIQDPVLKKEIAGFIGQEAHHAQAHEALNEFLAERDLPTEHIDRQVQWIIDLLCKTLLNEKNQLAITASLEHFTSMFSDLMLENPELLSEVDERLQAMFLWHAIEEGEHKAVAFDLYQAVDGSHARLMYTYFLGSLLLTLQTAYFQASLMAADGSLTDIKSWRKGLKWMFGRGPGQGHLRKMWPKYLDFMRRDFHPWQNDTSAQLQHWRGELDRLLAKQEAA